MAVPKKKTSPSRQNMRRSHHRVEKRNVITDSETGEYGLSHRIIHGMYKGKLVRKRDILQRLQSSNDA